MPDIPDTVSESAATSKSNKPGKKVESRIAGLWKKVEDSKKKDKIDIKKQSTNKIGWPAKNRVIPESDMAYLRPDEAQRKIISDFQKAKGSPNTIPNHSASTEKTDNKPEGSAIKVPSKSRLSIKLSKFKNKSNPMKKVL